MNAYQNPTDPQQPAHNEIPQPLPPAQPVVTSARRPSPGLALVLSFFPGLGHLYIGLYQRGMAFFLSFAAAIWLTDHADMGILIPFVIFFAVIDAYRQAVRIAQGLVPESLLEGGPKPKARPSGLGFGVFLTALGLILLGYRFELIDLYFLVDWWPMALVLFGVYLIAQHVIESKKRQQPDRDEAFTE